MLLTNILMGTFILIAIVETIYLRRDLDDHGFRIWLLFAFPALIASGILFILLEYLDRDFAELIIYSLSSAAMVAYFLGTVTAIRRSG